MLDQIALRESATENLQFKLNTWLIEYGINDRRLYDLFAFITNLFSQIPPELINYKIKIINDINIPLDGKEIQNIQNIGRNITADCSIIMLDASRFIIDNFNSEYNINTAIVYEYKGKQVEIFKIGKYSHIVTNYSYSTASSIFIEPFFSDVEDSLEFYYRYNAINTQCLILDKIWADADKQIFKPGPESDMRDSLWQFLRNTLRNTCTTKREQMADATKPVDIKITWMNNCNSIIEIKWLGDSMKANGKKTKHRDARANDGAKQLANYIDLFQAEEPDKHFVSYLVVYDGRRKRGSNNYYQNIEIKYDDCFKPSNRKKYIRFYLFERN